jgi:hypothetical protein
MLRYVLPTLAGIGFFVLIRFVTVAAAVLPVPPPVDPLAAFDPVMPGTPTEALSAFNCESAFFYSTVDVMRSYCRIRPGDGPVVSVTVTGESDRITNLWFTLRGVQMVDLVNRWGRPTRARHVGNMYLVWWGESRYAVVREGGWLTYQSPVRYLSLYEP